MQVVVSVDQAPKCSGARAEHIGMLGCSTEQLSIMEVNGRTRALNQAPLALKRGGCLVHRKRSEIDGTTTEMGRGQHGADVWRHLGLPGRCWERCCPSSTTILQTDNNMHKTKDKINFRGKIVRKHSFLYIYLYIKCKCCQSHKCISHKGGPHSHP